jgi:hypothetical protein
VAISTYTELQTAVADWLHRTDMTSVIQDCVALAEERFNRRLRTRQQETALSATAIDADYKVAVPSNTIAVKQIWRTDQPNTAIRPTTLEAVIVRQANGDPAYMYCWDDGFWRFDGTGTVAGVLYRNVPPLASNATNWLLTSYPSAYLFATLAETAAYTQDAQNGSVWESKAERAMVEIMQADKRDAYSGPLSVRTA